MKDKNSVSEYRFSFVLMFIIFALINVFVYISQKDFFIPTIILSVALLIYFYVVQSRLARIARKRIRESLNAAEDAASAVNKKFPVPMIVLSEEGNLLWYNNKAIDLIDISKINDERYIEDLMPGIEFNKIKLANEGGDSEIEINSGKNESYLDEEKAKINVNNDLEQKENLKTEEGAENEDKTLNNSVSSYIGGKHYDIVSFKVKNQQSGLYEYMLYFYEITFYKEIEERYENDRAIVAILEVDSFEDLMNEIKEEQRPKVQADIEEAINSWAKRMNAMIRKFDKAKYMVVMSNRYFQNVLAKRFEILDRIREIEVESSFKATLSIGVYTDDRSYIEMERGAFSALELALGRGGDQAAVKTMGEYSFYGGKSKAIEKRNKVKARIIAHAFRPIIDESRDVYIMGHQFPDMDAFGAAIGIYKAATDRGKKAKIVLEQPNETIISVYNTFKDKADEYFIKPDLAIQNFNSESDLLVVVDTHRPSFVECPELVEIAERKVVVDHHRRSVDMIDDTLLTYLEPYASSACELVTEMLQYMEKKPSLSKKEANALLAGMVLDTKNFSVQSGVRTFETAALLRRFGADTMDVKEFMQDDMESIVARSNIVSNARNFNETIAVSVSDQNIKNPRLIAAQAADQMLTIRGITASFVVVKEGEKVCISARSLKDVNVQVVLERMGGGGHRTGAGAQIEGMSVVEVENLLIREIEKYIQEED